MWKARGAFPEQLAVCFPSDRGPGPKSIRKEVLGTSQDGSECNQNFRLSIGTALEHKASQMGL